MNSNGLSATSSGSVGEVSLGNALLVLSLRMVVEELVKVMWSPLSEFEQKVSYDFQNAGCPHTGLREETGHVGKESPGERVYAYRALGFGEILSSWRMDPSSPMKLVVGSPSLVLHLVPWGMPRYSKWQEDGSSAGGKKHVIRRKLTAASKKPQQAMYLATWLPAVWKG